MGEKLGKLQWPETGGGGGGVVAGFIGDRTEGVHVFELEREILETDLI